MGLTAGLAIGSKENAIGVALALFILTLRSVPRGARIRSGAIWAGAAAAGGAYWFLRNFVRTGNPLPTLHLGIGSFTLPRTELPLTDPYDFRVIDYLPDPSVVREVFLPGYLDAAGSAAVPLALLAGIGILVGLRRAGPGRILATLAIAGIATYVITPYTALGPAGNPSEQLFTLNFRYVVTALAIGMAAGVVALAPRPGLAASRLGDRPLGVAAVAVAATTALAVFAPTAFEVWQVGIRMGAVSLIAGAVTVVSALTIHRVPTRFRVAITGAALVVGLVIGPILGTNYLERRFGPQVPVHQIVAEFGRSVSGESIGVTGLQLAYPLYGSRLDNDVTYIGRRLPHGGQADFTACAPWRRAVARSGVGWLVIAQPETSGRTTRPVAASWVEASPNADRVATSPTVEIFRLTGELDPATCSDR